MLTYNDGLVILVLDNFASLFPASNVGTVSSLKFIYTFDRDELSGFRFLSYSPIRGPEFLDWEK